MPAEPHVLPAAPTTEDVNGKPYSVKVRSRRGTCQMAF